MTAKVITDRIGAGARLAALAGALALAGCATAPAQPDAWVGGDPAHLAADKEACRKEAAGVDVNQINNYSESRYGMTSAMAAEVAKDNPLSDTGPQIRAATFTTCMNDKGWRQP